MLTLSLLRHAKSSTDEDTMLDADRPLARRGEKAAPAIGGYMRLHDLKPDLVLVSTARRTRDTWALIRPHLDCTPEELVEDGLYLASPAALLARLKRLPAAARHVLVVGHNPGLHALALDLVATGRREDITAMGRKFPTCALAVISFTQSSWKDLHPALGALRLYITPAKLG
ncbi:MAG: histidine phosphatase family protein [Hyphomicrobiaceae bacterium]